MVIKVKRDNHSNTFCGPAALSLLTGRHVDECVAQIRLNRRSRSPIKGVRTYELLEVLKQWGYPSTTLHVKRDWPKRDEYMSGSAKHFGLAHPTLVQFIRYVRKRKPDDKFLLVTKKHFLVLRGRKVYDNNHPAGIFIRQYNRRRTRIRQAYLIP